MELTEQEKEMILKFRIEKKEEDNLKEKIDKFYNEEIKHLWDDFLVKNEKLYNSTIDLINEFVDKQAYVLREERQIINGKILNKISELNDTEKKLLRHRYSHAFQKTDDTMLQLIKCQLKRDIHFYERNYCQNCGYSITDE